jgi:phospholipid transport system substrate-binding protein
MLRKLCQLVLGLTLSSAVILPLQADESKHNAYDVIENATTEVMLVVNAAGEYIDEDPERYYRELQTVLDGLVDYAGFSRAVMGPYATKERYRSLKPEGKVKLRQQVEAFTAVMRVGLVRTYGKGLIAFGGSGTEVQRPEAEADVGRSVAITQLIFGDAPEPYVIQYQMRRSKSGDWKLRNLIVETINLGVIYRNQFLAAAKDSEGDLDQVIDNWSAPAETQDMAQNARL